LNLAEQGFPVHLIERESELGGNLRKVRYFVNSENRDSGLGDSEIRDLGFGNSARFTESMDSEYPNHDPQAYLADLVGQVEDNQLITLHLQTELESTTGFKGNFASKLRNGSAPFEIKHGVTIVATGAVEYKGREYGYGTDPRIVTQQEFEGVLGKFAHSETRKSGNPELAASPGPQSPNPELPDSVVMIQCAGKPSEKFCSRICCTQALKNALKLKELHPQAQVVIIYRDMRAYGFKERLYTQAREKGVLFIHYDFDRKPEVTVNNGALAINVHEPQLGRDLTFEPDLLVLSMPIVPSHDADDLATRLKVSVDLDGFFLEAHVKLRPVDFSSAGVYMAGMAHYPKLLDETVIQAQAAAARAALILSKDTMTTSALIARVDPDLCVGCLTCLRICPFDVPKINPELTGVGGIFGAAHIEAAICHGCGSCAAECPAKAIEMMHYKDAQVLKKLDALFA
jgi:heterodisulfide reductase subunit A